MIAVKNVDKLHFWLWWTLAVVVVNRGGLIPRLHDQAGSTSWLYVSWASQLVVCWTFA